MNEISQIKDEIVYFRYRNFDPSKSDPTYATCTQLQKLTRLSARNIK